MIIWIKIDTPEIQAPATQYGYMLDYLYAVNLYKNDGTMGNNIARRATWPVDMYIYAREFTDEEIVEQEIADPLPHGVFGAYAGEEFEFEPTDKTMHATDWMISTRVRNQGLTNGR